VWPALRPYLNSALIDPVEDAKLVRNAVVVGTVPPTEFEVREEGREIVLTRRSLIHQQLVVVFNRARLAAEPTGVSGSAKLLMADGTLHVRGSRGSS